MTAMGLPGVFSAALLMPSNIILFDSVTVSEIVNPIRHIFTFSSLSTVVIPSQKISAL